MPNEYLHVFLVGTSHTYQYGNAANRPKAPCSPQQEQAFREFIRSTINVFDVIVIAEEFNAECLTEGEIEISVLQSIALELGCPHLFCEPNRKEREAAGIQQENDIRISVFMNGGTDAEIRSRLQDQFRRREEIWLRRLQEFGHTPVLFVCGANHVSSFEALLSNAGIRVEVLHADWQA